VRVESKESRISTQAPRRRYRRPPVLEAIIDIRAELPEGTDLTQLGALHSGEVSRYPTRDEIVQGTLTVQVGPALSGTAAQQAFGYRLFSPQKDRVVQVRLDGFACSKLQPYDSWERNRDEARRLWSKYVECARPKSVTRIAVRYINRVRLPAMVNDLTEYFRVRPEIASDMPHLVSGFAMRLDIPQPDLQGAMLRLNQGSVPDQNAGRMAFLLDLDLFQAVQLPPTGPELWKALEVLHNRENLLFEHCITDRTRALFA
jgi:uncharacterized protein (TIGR04255 family)